MGSISLDNPPLEVPWKTIKGWVDQHESRNTELSALSKSQLAALSCLFPFVPAEPELDDKDYISELMHIGQQQRKHLPTFKDLSPIEVPVDGAFQLRWRCICTIPWSKETIPAEGYGYEAGESPPLFSSKKRAKQFAAREALRYLTSANPRTPAPKTVQFASTTPTLSPEPTASTTPRTPSPPKHSHIQLQQPTTQTSSALSARTPRPVPDDSTSLYARVAAMAATLGTGVPTYRIEEDPTRPNFYSGRAVFFNGAPVPTDIGVVAGVLGKKQTKLQIAERVLEWMEDEKAKRDTILGTVFSPRRL